MKVNEKNFVSKLKKRDEEALRFVIKEYGPLVKAIVSKQLYNLQSVQDECINDIFLGIWNNIGKFDERKGSFKNWIIGVSKYKSIDYLRKYIKDIDNLEYDSLEIVTPDNCSKEILKREIVEKTAELLACLNEKDRDIFKKYFFEEMEPFEIAASLGVKTSSIYNRISRGRKKLKAMKSIY